MSSRDVKQEIEADLRPVSRRKFLKWFAVGAAGTVAAASGGYAVLFRGSSIVLPGTIKHLSSKDYEIFRRLAGLLLPTGGTDLPAVDDLPVMQNIDALIGHLPPNLQGDVGTALKLFDSSALAFGGQLTSFVKMSDAKALAYFDSWQSGNELQRGISLAFTKIVYLSYWRESMTWPPLDYEGPITKKYGIPSLGNAPFPEG